MTEQLKLRKILVGISCIGRGRIIWLGTAPEGHRDSGFAMGAFEPRKTTRKEAREPEGNIIAVRNMIKTPKNGSGSIPQKFDLRGSASCH